MINIKSTTALNVSEIDLQKSRRMSDKITLNLFNIFFCCGVCLKKSEPILRKTLVDRLRFALAERSGAAEFPPHPPSAALSLGLSNFLAATNKISIEILY